MQSEPLDHQLDTLRIYGSLVSEREQWGGALVLCCGEKCALTGIPVAVSIAGGTTLAVDSNAVAMKNAMRQGELDFVVNTLDEALRVLKNEIRQKRALSVGFIADADIALAEAVERGLLPDRLVVGFDQPAQAILRLKPIQALREAGMRVDSAAEEGGNSSRSGFAISGRRYYEHFFPAASAAELRDVDKRILAFLPAEDRIRRRWIERVTQYLQQARTGGRWMLLAHEEYVAFASSAILSSPLR